MGINKSRRSSSRLAAIKALYSGEINEKINNQKSPAILALDIITMYHESEDEEDDKDIDETFLSQIIKGVCENKADLDKSIAKFLSEGWRFERLGPVIQSILRAAVLELMQYSDTPKKVIINEYVNITHGFYDDKEVGFVNGILDKIAQEVRGDE